MKITAARFYGGARDKVCRLGLANLFLELQDILLGTEIRIIEDAEANGAGSLREMIDDEFRCKDGWQQTTSGDVDWTKQFRYNSTFVARIGVEIQVSARSDLLIRDIVHLRNSLQAGRIDVGVIVVPSDRFQSYLTDRTPSFRDAQRYIEVEFKEAMDMPIIVLAIEHDGPGDIVLPKKVTNKGKGNKGAKPKPT
jgi:Restriction endonuclease BglII